MPKNQSSKIKIQNMYFQYFMPMIQLIQGKHNDKTTVLIQKISKSLKFSDNPGQSI